MMYRESIICTVIANEWCSFQKIETVAERLTQGFETPSSLSLTVTLVYHHYVSVPVYLSNYQVKEKNTRNFSVQNVLIQLTK